MKIPRHFFAILFLLGAATPRLFAQTATPNQIPELEQKLAAATSPAEQAMLCNELAFAALKKDIDKALAYADRALAYAREAYADREVLKAMNLRGDAFVKKKDLPAAEKAYKDAFTLLKTAPDRELEGRTHHNFGKLAQTRGDTTAAIRYYEQAFSIRESIGDKKGLAATVNNLGVLYCKLDFAKSNFYYEKSLQLKKEAGDRPGVAITQANLSQNYVNMGRLDLAQQLLDSAIVTNLAIDNKNSLAICYQKKGAIESRLGHSDAAIDFFEKAKTMFEAVGDHLSVAAIENDIGQHYMTRSNYPKAMEHFLPLSKRPELPQGLQFSVLKGLADVKGYQHFNQESLEYCEKALALAQTDAERAPVLISRAQTENILRQRDKAEATARTSLIFAKKAQMPYFQALSLLQLSNVHFSQKKLPEALAEVREVIDIGKKIKGDFLPSALTLQSNIYSAMGGEGGVLGLENAQKALELAQKQGALEDVISAQDALSSAYTALGKTEEAVQALRKAEALKDSLYSSEKTRDIARMEKDADFEAERNQARLAQAQKDAAAAAELDHQKTTRNGLLGGLLAVLALSGAGFYTFRKRQKLRTERREAENRQRIARDLHDEVGSTLSAISILSASTLHGVQKDLDQARFGNIGDKARAALDSISDIVWSVNPENDSMEKTLARMSTYASEMLENVGAELHFEVGEGVELLTLPMEKRKNFYLIFKEAVHNCAKYARARQVQVMLRKEGNCLVLSVKDDGVGFEMPAATRDLTTLKKLSNLTGPGASLGGNGLPNMHSRAAAMGADFQIESAAGVGTIVLLKIPIKP